MSVADDYFARVRPLLGDGLSKAIVEVDDPEPALLVLELLTSCMLEHVVTSRPAALQAMHAWKRPFAPLHATRLLRRHLVIVPEQMEHAVDQEPFALARERLAALGRLPSRRVDRDDDVAEQLSRRAAVALPPRPSHAERSERQQTAATGWSIHNHPGFLP